MRVVILSFTPTDIMIEALKRVKLYQYFKIIIGTDTSPHLVKKQNKIYDIIKLKDDNKLFWSDQILYVDSNKDDIDKISSQCRTYFVDNRKSRPFMGPTPDDFDHIEAIVNGNTPINGTRKPFTIEIENFQNDPLEVICYLFLRMRYLTLIIL